MFRPELRIILLPRATNSTKRFPPLHERNTRNIFLALTPRLLTRTTFLPSILTKLSSSSFRSGFLSTRYPFLSLFHDPTGKQTYRGRVFQTDSWTRIFVVKRRSLKRKDFFSFFIFTSNNYNITILWKTRVEISKCLVTKMKIRKFHSGVKIVM